MVDGEREVILYKLISGEGEQPVYQLNALDLTDPQLRILSDARASGKTKGGVDRLADSGAQIIMSFGREGVRETFEGEEDRFTFELNESDVRALETLFNDPELVDRC